MTIVKQARCLLPNAARPISGKLACTLGILLLCSPLRAGMRIIPLRIKIYSGYIAMINLYRLTGLLAGMLLSANVYAGDLKIEGVWSRATAPGQDTAMVDLSITSKQAATLVGYSSPASKTVELHSMVHDNGVMKMREVKTLELPAGKRVTLGESGYHLMLIGLKAPLKAGDSVPLTLNIRTVNKAVLKIEARAEVKPLTEAAPQADEHMHQHHH